MFDLNDCAAFIASNASKVLAVRLEKRMASYHVTRAQWLAIYYLDKQPGMTQNQLAECLGSKDSTVVSLLDHLERSGYVVRTSNAQDRRIKQVQLTKKGSELNQKLTVISEKFKNDAIKDIDEDSLNQYKHVIDMMLKNTEE
jgi:DNA-binding MarR family transcriptional regulator